MITAYWVEKLCKKSKLMNIKAGSMSPKWFVAGETLVHVLIIFFKNQPMIDMMMEN